MRCILCVRASVLNSRTKQLYKAQYSQGGHPCHGISGQRIMGHGNNLIETSGAVVARIGMGYSPQKYRSALKP